VLGLFADKPPGFEEYSIYFPSAQAHALDHVNGLVVFVCDVKVIKKASLFTERLFRNLQPLTLN
jgi:hypothetical protein